VLLLDNHHDLGRFHGFGLAIIVVGHNIGFGAQNIRDYCCSYLGYSNYSTYLNLSTAPLGNNFCYFADLARFPIN
jgi:hypothetical protein